MNAAALLENLRRQGVSVRLEDERLRYSGPSTVVTPEVATQLRHHKQEILRILREDEGMRRTGIIQSERQVSELAREYLGPSHPFDPDEHPPSKRELWVDSDKEAFFFPYRYLGRGGTA